MIHLLPLGKPPPHSYKQPLIINFLVCDLIDKSLHRCEQYAISSRKQKKAKLL